MENFVILITCQNPREAYFLKDKLFSEGVEAYIAGPSGEKITGKESLSNPLMVQVKSGDVEKAVQILIRINQELKTIATEEKESSSKKILVPIDFSKHSTNACIFAFALAKNLDAEIKLLHVYTDPFIDSGYFLNRISFEKYEKNVLSEIEEMAHRNMAAFVQILQTELKKLDLDQVKFHYNLLKGKAAYQIISLADLFDPVMIVLGTQGSGKMPNDLIGSVTTKVIESINVPILAIPENWKYKSISTLKILYATDFYNSDFSAFKKLQEILKPFRLHFDCVHIEINESHPWKEMQMFKLESRLCKEFPEVSIKFHMVSHTNLLKGIQEFVEKAETDIISFISPKRSFMYKLVNHFF